MTGRPTRVLRESTRWIANLTSMRSVHDVDRHQRELSLYLLSKLASIEPYCAAGAVDRLRDSIAAQVNFAAALDTPIGRRELTRRAQGIDLVVTELRARRTN
jgi:hypothetical protein